jgi:hypothetical protein
VLARNPNKVVYRNASGDGYCAMDRSSWRSTSLEGDAAVAWDRWFLLRGVGS